MKYKNTVTKIILSTLILVLSTVFVNAGFGVSPTDISNKYLKPGLSFEREFMISRSGSLEELEITIEPELGEIGSWFTYSPGKTFLFKRGESVTTFKVIVSVPTDADYKDYSGVVRVLAKPANQAVQGVTITQGIRLDAGLVVTEVDVKALSITAIDVSDIYLGNPVEIEITGENQGNVDVSPTVKVKVMDLLMNVLEEHDIEDFGSIGPNKTERLIASFETDLPPGEYFVEVTVLLDGEELRTERLVFNILDAPLEEKHETEKQGGFSLFLNSIGDNLPYILVAVGSLLLIYYLIGKMWSMKDLQKKATAWWAVLLGSRKYTRMILSFFLALQIMLILILYPLLSLKPQTIPVEQGDTQGVQDVAQEDLRLNVFPSIRVPEYLIYEQPNTESKVLYAPEENEQLNVLEQQGDWYKVEIEDGTTGWLHRSLVKSKLTQEN